MPLEMYCPKVSLWTLNGSFNIYQYFLQNEIALTLSEAFESCIAELGPYSETAREFSELPESDSSSVHAETDVESLQTRLSSLTEQQTLAKGIKDTQNVSIFRADFRPLKRIVLPNISKVCLLFCFTVVFHTS